MGATLYVDRIPVSSSFESCKELMGENAWINMAISSGDDYELCFTTKPELQDELQQRLSKTQYTCIGEVDTSLRLRCEFENGNEFIPESSGYDHFRDQ